MCSISDGSCHISLLFIVECRRVDSDDVHLGASSFGYLTRQRVEKHDVGRNSDANAIGIIAPMDLILCSCFGGLLPQRRDDCKPALFQILIPSIFLQKTRKKKPINDDGCSLQRCTSIHFIL